MDIHRLRINLTSIADDIEKAAMTLRRAGNAHEIQKSINDLVWLAGSLVRIEEFWREL